MVKSSKLVSSPKKFPFGIKLFYYSLNCKVTVHPRKGQNPLNYALKLDSLSHIIQNEIIHHLSETSDSLKRFRKFQWFSIMHDGLKK
jgi:hypothetical protein